VYSNGTDLYAVAAGALWKIGADKNNTKIADGMEPAVDGLEQVAPNEFLVSVWNGVVYYVKGGKAQPLIDTRAQNSNTADIGFDPATKTVYVPTFFKNCIVAYKLTEAWLH
jgi:hypothetical protein